MEHLHSSLSTFPVAASAVDRLDTSNDGALGASPPSDDIRWKVQDRVRSHSDVLVSSLSFVVVDDVRATCEVVHALLRALGAGPGKISLCTSLALAEHRVLSGPADVILGDLHLSDGSGLDLLKLIRRTPSRSDAIFMLITNDPNEEALVRAQQLRVSAVIAKPLSFQKLQEHLLRCLVSQGV
jgi:CheY-like chemotaxis protein